MQKKRINTILIVAVALIWGIVLFKFAMPYFSETPGVVTSEVLAVRPMQSSHQKDTLVLEKLDRDPFLGKTMVYKKPIRTTTKTTKRLPAKKVAVLWPKVQYFGFVKSKDRKTSRLGLVRVDGKLLRVREKQKINEDVKVTKIAQDSIGLLLNRQVKFFKR